MTERTVVGRFYRVLIDKANNIWERQSFWKKASDVEFNDGSNLENNRPVGILKRNTLYKEGAVAYISIAPSWVRLVCTKEGTTDDTVPAGYSSSTLAVGDVVSDNTAEFTVYGKIPSNTFADNSFMIPSMKLVYDINSQLTASNGSETKRFIFAYQGGKYGYILGDDMGGEGPFVPF